MDEDPFELAAANHEVVAAARAWIDHLRDGAIGPVWRGLAPDCRLAYAQAWIFDNPAVMADPRVETSSRDELAAALAGPDPQEAIWPAAHSYMLRQLSYPNGRLEHEGELGSGANPRPLAPGVELVRFFLLADVPRDASGNYYFPPGSVARNLALVMQQVGDDWLVAGVGHGILEPGWPPTFQRLAEVTD